jgi:hypothetical protein
MDTIPERFPGELDVAVGDSFIDASLITKSRCAFAVLENSLEGSKIIIYITTYWREAFGSCRKAHSWGKQNKLHVGPSTIRSII